MLSKILEHAAEIMDGSHVARYNEIFFRGNDLQFIELIN